MVISGACCRKVVVGRKSSPNNISSVQNIAMWTKRRISSILLSSFAQTSPLKKDH
jgi:hypothetical protein